MRLPGFGLPKEIGILFFVRLINAMGNFVYPFLTMLLTIKLGWKPGHAGAFMTVMLLVGGIGTLVGGKLGDSLGRRRVIILSQTGAALIYLLCFALGMSPVLPYLIAVANFLLSGSWPVFNAMVADLVTAEQRKRAYSLLYWGNNIGFSLGPLFAGFLFTSHPALMFGGNAAALLVAAFLLRRFVGESLPDAAAIEASKRSGGREAAAEGGFVRALLAKPILLGFALSMIVLNFVYAQQQFSLPLFLSARLGEAGPSVFGAAMTVNGLTVVAATALVTLILGRMDSLACMAVASCLYAAGFGMLALVGSPILGTTPGSIVVFASTVVWTLGEIVSATNANVFIASHSPLSHRGRINSVVQWISMTGSMFSPALAGAYVGARGVAAVWPLTAGLALVGALLMATLGFADRARGPRAIGRTPT